MIDFVLNFQQSAIHNKWRFAYFALKYIVIYVMVKMQLLFQESVGAQVHMLASWSREFAGMFAVPAPASAAEHPGVVRNRSFGFKLSELLFFFFFLKTA